MGHRGARDKALENTIESFQHFITTGYEVVEFDVHSTKDNIWIVHHDKTLERLTNSKAAIKDLMFSDLKNIIHNDGQPIPSLEEVLLLFSKTNIELQIEVKSDGDFIKLLDQINSYPQFEKITVISFHHRILLKLKDKVPQLKTVCLMEALPVNPVGIIKDCQANGISLSVRTIDQELVEQCHQAGFTVTAWNANDKKTYDYIKSIGVDIVGTDVPFSIKSFT